MQVHPYTIRSEDQFVLPHLGGFVRSEYDLLLLKLVRGGCVDGTGHSSHSTILRLSCMKLPYWTIELVAVVFTT